MLTVETVIEHLASQNREDILAWEVSMDFINYFPDCHPYLNEKLGHVVWDEVKVNALRRHLTVN